jgi:hypothetical protein
MQDIDGTLLYYGQAVDPTILPAISASASQQSQGMEAVADACHQLLDYVATHPNAGIGYLSSNMILAIHTNASYLPKHNGCSWASAHFYLIKKEDKDFNDCAILNLVSVIKHVMSSALEAELAALYYSCKLAVPIHITLDEMGHTQPQMPVTTEDISTRSHRRHHDPKGFQINESMIPLVKMPTGTTSILIPMTSQHTKSSQLHP